MSVGFRAVDGNHDNSVFVGPDTQSMIVEGDNAGRAGTDHLHIDPLSQAHFFESNDEVVFAIDLMDTTLFAGAQKFEGNQLLQVTVSHWVTDGRRVMDTIEIQSHI
jgi:hypothetical protein